VLRADDQAPHPCTSIARGSDEGHGAGVSPKELALIRKTLRADPGTAVVIDRGPDGERRVRLRHGTDRAAQLARLKARARRAELMLLQARVEESDMLRP
jgi:hypothetical protein